MSCKTAQRNIVRMRKIAGEPYTSRGVRTVRGRDEQNLLWQHSKAWASYPTINTEMLI